MFADEIRLAIEASSRIALPAVTALLWQAFGDGKVSEAEAEALSGLIEARSCRSGQSERSRTGMPLPEGPISQARSGSALSDGATDAPPNVRGPIRTPGIGSRPRTDASLERRRRWAASGRLPPTLAARFTLAEQAVLALVAAETARRGDCRLAVRHIAAVVGVAETTVRNAIREARVLGLLTVEERRLTGFRNDTNVVRIVSPEWTAWLRLARKGMQIRHSLDRDGVQDLHLTREGGGCKSAKGTPTQVSTKGKTRTASPSRRSPARLDPSSREALRSAGARPRRCAGEGAAPGPR